MEQAVAAPMCTRVLADFGARVIKVENPDGGDFARHYDDVVDGPGGLAAHFVWCNRGKESVTLNTKSPAGWELLHRLLDRADVFVSNLAPGATARLGVAAADLAHRHPDVIAVEIDGYGPGGPISHKRAYDLLVQAESGSCAITGSPGMPAKPGPAIADFSTGLYAAMSIDDAARAREHPRSCPAPSVELSLFDVMTDVMGYALTYTQHSGIDQRAARASVPRPCARTAPIPPATATPWCSAPPTTANGSGWHGRSSTAPTWPSTPGSRRTPAVRPPRDPRRGDRILVCPHDLADIQKTADEAGIGNARYNMPSQVVVHPQLSARDRWRRDHPRAGHLGAAAAAGHHRFRTADGRGPRPRPAHRRRARRTGVTAAELASLRADGAIGPP